MAPTTLSMIVNWPHLRAGRALPGSFVRDKGFDDFSVPINLNVDDAPRGLNPQKLLLKVDIAHGEDYAASPSTYCFSPH